MNSKKKIVGLQLFLIMLLGTPLITSVLSQTFKVNPHMTTLTPITGVHVPKVDSFFDVSNPPGSMGEWDDGVKQAVELKGTSGSLSTEIVSKVVGRHLYLAFELSSTVNLARIVVALSSDPENDNGVTEGDIRLVWSHNMKAPANLVKFEGWPCSPGTLTVEDFTQGKWVVHSSISNIVHESLSDIGQVAACEQKGEPTQVEVDINFGYFDQDYSDRNDYAPVQYSLLVETGDTGNPSWYGWPEAPSTITEDNQVTIPSYHTAYFDPSLPIFSNTVNVGIDHIELTQAVQTADNAMPLVLNKTSLARVFVTNPSGTDVEVEVQLYGFWFPFVILIPLGGVSQNFTAPPSPDRTNLADSANFVLPAFWVNFPILFLKAVVTPINLIESSIADNHLYDAFTLEGTHNINTYIQRINTGTASIPVIPSDTFIDAARDAMTAIFPSNPYYNYLSWETLGVWDTSVRTKSELKAELTEIAGEIFIAALFLHLLGIDSLPFPDQVHGISASNIHGTGGSSNPSWLGGASVASFGSWGTSRELTMAHEIIHNLGPGLDTDAIQWGRHVGDTDPSTWNYQGNPDFVAENPNWGCGSSGGDVGWPRTTDDIGILGWNFNTGNLVPETHPDVMSYCQSGTTPTKWISDYRWQKLFDYLRSYPSSSSIESPLKLKTNKVDFTLPWWYANITQIQMVSGFLYSDGSAKLRPSYSVMGAMPPNPDPDPKSTVANLVVTFDNNTEKKIPLAANFTRQNYTHEASAVIPFQDVIPFSVNIPIDPNTKILSLRIEDLATQPSTLDERTTQPTSFTASLTDFTMPKTIVRGVSNPISWKTTVSGVPEYFTRLEYSPGELLPDGNRSNLLWIPLGVLTSTDPGAHDLLFDTLPGGDQAQFRLLVSDGITTKWLYPNTLPTAPQNFTVPNLLPAIQFPRINPVSTLGSMVSLQVSGNDPETGPLAPNKFYFQVKDENGVVLISPKIQPNGDVYVGRFTTPGKYSLTAFAIDPLTKLEVGETTEFIVVPSKNYLSETLWKEFVDALALHREGYSHTTTSVSPVPLIAVLVAVVGVAYKSRKKE